MSNVKERVVRFFVVAKSIINLISKVAKVVGDGLAVIKVVDTIVDTFIEKRQKGELKGADFLEYAGAVAGLVVDLAPYAGSVTQAVEDIYRLIDAYVDAHKQMDKENA